MQTAIGQQNGRFFTDTGNSRFVAFQHACEALACAVRVQQQLAHVDRKQTHHEDR